MQDISTVENFASILAGDYSVETKVVINGVDYGEDVLWSVQTDRQAFDSENPTIGCAEAGTISIKMNLPAEEIPRSAQIRPYVRIFNSSLTSGWIPKGVYYISERFVDEEMSTIEITGYDDMVRANIVYPSSALAWDDSGPNARSVLDEIAGFMGVELDDRTIEAIPSETEYIVSFPAQYTMREVLGSIAAMYGGNFVMSDEGKLLLIGLTDLPTETYYLTTEYGSYLTFGGTRILLRSDV